MFFCFILESIPSNSDLGQISWIYEAVTHQTISANIRVVTVKTLRDRKSVV